MKIATTSNPRVRTAASFLLIALAAAGLAAWRTIDAPRPLTTNQTLAFLPAGSSVHSLVRADMDGRAPTEVAVVARIPAFPGSSDISYAVFLFRYDMWRRRYIQIYRGPSPGTVPFSADAARLVAGLDAAVFSGLHDDGTQSYQIVGLIAGRAVVLREARFAGTLGFREPLLVERTDGGARAFRWDGQTWVEEAAPGPPADVPPPVTWRYAVRNGAVVARSPVQRLQPRQPLRVLAVGGGPATVVVADQRFDVVEAGFRQRQPGTYTIRIVTGFTPLDQAYTLTVIVEP